MWCISNTIRFFKKSMFMLLIRPKQSKCKWNSIKLHSWLKYLLILLYNYYFCSKSGFWYQRFAKPWLIWKIWELKVYCKYITLRVITCAVLLCFSKFWSQILFALHFFSSSCWLHWKCAFGHLCAPVRHWIHLLIYHFQNKSFVCWSSQWAAATHTHTQRESSLCTGSEVSGSKASS